MEANTSLKTSIRLHNDRLGLLAYYERKREITITDVRITCQTYYQTFACVNVQCDTRSPEGTGQLFIVPGCPRTAAH